jgi:hypothetical protein
MRELSDATRWVSRKASYVGWSDRDKLLSFARGDLNAFGFQG